MSDEENIEYIKVRNLKKKLRLLTISKSYGILIKNVYFNCIIDGFFRVPSLIGGKAKESFYCVFLFYKKFYKPYLLLQRSNLELFEIIPI